MSEIIFKIASTEEEIIAARNIRKNVFVLEQGIPEGLPGLFRTCASKQEAIHAHKKRLPFGGGLFYIL